MIGWIQINKCGNVKQRDWTRWITLPLELRRNEPLGLGGWMGWKERGVWRGENKQKEIIRCFRFTPSQLPPLSGFSSAVSTLGLQL